MTQVSSSETWLTLYCLPHAGGSARPYGRLEAAVPPGVRVVPLELPGHGRRLREPLLRDIGQVVTEVIRLMGEGRHRPFALFGHSFGALVGYETARRLRQLGTPPELLLVSGRNSPVWPPSHEPLHMLPDPSFTAGLSRMGGIPEALLAEPAVLHVYLPSLRADLRMVETYAHTHSEPLDVPIAAFAGLQDRLTEPTGMEAWAETTSRRFDLTLLRGGHFFLDEPEFRTALASRLGPIGPPAVAAATESGSTAGQEHGRERSVVPGGTRAELSRDEIYRTISAHVEKEFLGGSGVCELTPDTPLSAANFLGSTNTRLLLSSFIRTQLGVEVPPVHVTDENFATLRTITDMVAELSGRPASRRSTAPPGSPPNSGTPITWDSAG